MVVGHTDNVHVANPETIRQGHKDNWYLSAHRAIAVTAELRKQSVSPTRLEVAGFADQRPVSPNTTDAGRALNRRVEVLILPAAPTGSVAEAPGTPIQANSKVAKSVPLNKDTPARETPNKDTPVAPTSGRLNK
jgi:chemotaxis protein MotB